MIVPEHRACDICGEPVYGDLQNKQIRKVYFEVKYPEFDKPAKEFIRSSDIDICKDCWAKMKVWVIGQLKEENGNT